MTPKRLFETFKREFPWFETNIVKYQANRSEGGIDIWMDTNVILNFQINKTGWVLKRK